MDDYEEEMLKLLTQYFRYLKTQVTDLESLSVFEEWFTFSLLSNEHTFNVIHLFFRHLVFNTITSFATTNFNYQLLCTGNAIIL